MRERRMCLGCFWLDDRAVGGRLGASVEDSTKRLPYRRSVPCACACLLSVRPAGQVVVVPVLGPSGSTRRQGWL